MTELWFLIYLQVFHLTRMMTPNDLHMFQGSKPPSMRFSIRILGRSMMWHDVATYYIYILHMIRIILRVKSHVHQCTRFVFSSFQNVVILKKSHMCGMGSTKEFSIVDPIWSDHTETESWHPTIVWLDSFLTGTWYFPLPMVFATAAAKEWGLQMLTHSTSLRVNQIFHVLNFYTYLAHLAHWRPCDSSWKMT